MSRKILELDDLLTQLAQAAPLLLALASLSAPLHDDGTLTRHGASRSQSPDPRAPARDLRAVLGPGQAPQVPPLPSSLLIVTVISTWSEAQSWSLLLFLPHLSPASQLLADVCVCVCEPTRDRAQPHMEEERETTCRLCNSAPLTGRAATLLSPVVLPQSASTS